MGERSVEEYLETLVEVGDAPEAESWSRPPPWPTARTYEDNRILEAALACGALLIVANDSDLVHMSPWKDILIIPAREFAG